MPKAFDGTVVPSTLEKMPCGGVPVFDADSGYAYRCDQCFAVIGSVGQPTQCKEINAAATRSGSGTWREHDNDGMRYPENSDLMGGQTDC